MMYMTNKYTRDQKPVHWRGQRHLLMGWTQVKKLTNNGRKEKKVQSSEKISAVVRNLDFQNQHIV